MRSDIIAYLISSYSSNKIVEVTIDIERCIVEVITDKTVIFYNKPEDTDISRKEERYG